MGRKQNKEPDIVYHQMTCVINPDFDVVEGGLYVLCDDGSIKLLDDEPLTESHVVIGVGLRNGEMSLRGHAPLGDPPTKDYMGV